MGQQWGYRTSLIILVSFIFSVARGQADHFAYAVTAVSKAESEWVALRKLDTRSGSFSGVLLDLKDKSPFDIAFYKLSGTSGAAYSTSGNQGSMLPMASLGNSVAAIAYDRKSNRLYFTPMNLDQLRYIDLYSMQVFTLSDLYFSKAGNYDFRTAGPINRMVIAPDDCGYTVTNDGNHLIRFTTKGSPSLVDLGELLDDPLNKENTIHNPCANSGGDLVADDAGHLLLIVSTNRVYQVDIASRKASFLQNISGLPSRFITSGAAVTDDNKIVISSSAYPDGFFVVDPENWEALPAPAGQDLYGSADLANSNFLRTKKAGNFILDASPEKAGGIRIFPNPLLFDEFSVQFNELPQGQYTIQVASVLGRVILEKKLLLGGHAQTEKLHIPGFAAQGLYYVRVMDATNKIVSIQKLVVERW